MKQYLLSIYRDEASLSEEELQRSYDAVNALADELTAAGGLVFAGGLNHSTSTVVRVVDDQIVTTDGPFAETKEHLGRFWIVEAADLGAAREWGARLAVACRRTIEVSTFEDDDATVEELFEHLSDSTA
jgi:hypothetical protein